MLLKWVHIVSSTLLFGAALGSSKYCWLTHKSQEVRAIATVLSTVVTVDWLVVTTTGFIQPASGLLLMQAKGYGLWEPWLVTAYVLYVIVTFLWFIVAWLQIQCRNMVRIASSWKALPDGYHANMRLWAQLATPTFALALVIFWLMVSKPQLW